MYIKRHIENCLKQIADMYPAVLVTGARQVGKSTLIQNEIEGIEYITFDDLRLQKQAADDPALFFKVHEPPIIIDEIQYEPDLFPYIKILADEKKQSGMFYMTGSQAFQLMKNVSESLAGRVGVLDLYGLSYREIKDIAYTKPFFPTTAHIDAVKGLAPKLDYREIWHIIQKGSFPQIYQKDYNAEQREIFFSRYLRTYIERDVRALTQVADERAFLDFITATASLTAQQLNYQTIAKAVGKDVNTIKRWMSILVTSGLVTLLEPYHDNVLKRIAKTPKLHFMDTGLACYLCGWHTPETLQKGAFAGQIFETFAVTEIMKSYANAGIDTRLNFFYYRDEEMREIDLIIKRNGVLYPIEVKKAGSGEKKDVKNFDLLKKSGCERGEGALVCLDETLGFLTEKDRVISVNMI